MEKSTCLCNIGTYDTPETEDITYYRMDMVWGFLSELKRVDASPRFKYLLMVAKLMLCIPHSNAGEERVSNVIKLNKTLVPHETA